MENDAATESLRAFLADLEDRLRNLVLSKAVSVGGPARRRRPALLSGADLNPGPR